MPQSLLEKIQTLISASLHDLLNKALKANDIAVLKQYLDQLYVGQQTIQDEQVNANADCRTFTRKLEEQVLVA